MSSALLVEIVVEGVTPEPLACLGRPEFGSQTAAVFAPDMPKTTAPALLDVLRVIVIVSEDSGPLAIA